MAKGHRSQIKRERNEVKDTRPSAQIVRAECIGRSVCIHKQKESE